MRKWKNIARDVVEILVGGIAVDDCDECEVKADGS